MESHRHAGRHRANRAERDSQPPGCPKGDGPVRRAPRQRGGLNRLGLVAAKRLPTSTKDAPLIPDLEAQSRGVVGGESGVGGCYGYICNTGETVPSSSLTRTRTSGGSQMAIGSRDSGTGKLISACSVSRRTTRPGSTKPMRFPFRYAAASRSNSSSFIEHFVWVTDYEVLFGWIEIVPRAVLHQA